MNRYKNAYGILIKNLPWHFEKKDLSEYFLKFGSIVHIDRSINPKTGFYTPDTHIYFSSRESIDKILENKHTIQNHKLLISLSTNSKSNTISKTDLK
ncbi:unnamed protein product [Brachionus calyciflorus]|uniref:RRM domain-containing protein n=1 Tax=Brachionus calyciflorus TaxID=104777 RepID=A0A814C2R7_9BILA|nr:unnamed protein product [Brachionus calyciflorus]